MSAAQYARLVPKKYRSKTLPKIDRPWRPRVIAWAGPAAFYPNRFYEVDKWYKARIDKPEKLPEMHIIEPAEHMKSLKVLMQKSEIEQINIGFKRREVAGKAEKSAEDRIELERKSRHMQLKIDIDHLDVENLSIYRHFQVFDHLFGDNIFFENVQNLQVNFENDIVVHSGNVITANSTLKRPEITIESVGNGGGFNTLLMINLDGNALDLGKNGEIVQWMISNIPDGEAISAGSEIIDYLQPLPFYGTGYHRVAFVLFRHEKPVDFQIQGNSLDTRIHEISKFYKKHEATITPSAIRFFQTSYDNSVKMALHGLGMTSPLYEYEHRPALKPAQREFPEKPQPFDLYLDMYRDPKEVEQEMLEKRLAEVKLDYVKEPKWVDTDYVENKKKLPAWLHAKKLERDGVGHAKYHNDL
ncbi:Large ribosomal subunit protein mL38 [Caenorhabditis elegans]|uniref:Large ribosomal subunit protein mL38 n=1 Tax=Caenorhabditis elegans TaxID=6239 RepID=Q9BL86_CAEEL|nr:Mitochondrial Ribosomal Protein, Large [Caenorhabditis elegans]CCD68049.1 Mitochondrial Ribosomal Protein, Large [Caenorhabditis elegans]|eukprot:NP_490808.1 Mitochondrial Ribosomal Protein, Large [Caenorhabditis elegans]